jgi:hypothetical protein
MDATENVHSSPIQAMASSIAQNIRAEWPKWLDSHTPLNTDVELPQPATLDAFIAECLLASLTTEEQRPVVFRVTFCPRKALEDAEEDYIPAFPRSLTFAPPRPFLVGEVMRLAPATDPRQVTIAVDAGAEGLQIWGLIQTGISGRNYSDNYPDGLVVEAYEPGSLRFSRRDHVFAELRRGQLFSAVHDVLIRGRLATSLNEPIEALQSGMTSSLNREVDVESAEESYVRVLKRIIDGIRERAHGGMLLIVPHATALSLIPTVTFKYLVEWDRLWDLILGAAVQDEQFSATNPHSVFGPNKISAPQFFQIVKLRGSMNDALADSLDLVISFSQVDGAVVMTDRMKIIGFGAQLPMNPPSSIWKCQDAEAQSVEEVAVSERGMRHRAAYSICDQLPSSIAFVFSQDGGVQAVARQGDRVMVWPDIDTNILTLSLRKDRVSSTGTA